MGMMTGTGKMGMMMGTGKMGMMMGGGCVSGRETVFNNGPVGGNSCPSSSPVSEADCLEAVLDLLPAGQTQGRTHLVAGSWGWVPPGCSVQPQSCRAERRRVHPSLSKGANHGLRPWWRRYDGHGWHGHDGHGWHGHDGHGWHGHDGHDGHGHD